MFKKLITIATTLFLILLTSCEDSSTNSSSELEYRRASLKSYHYNSQEWKLTSETVYNYDQSNRLIGYDNYSQNGVKTAENVVLYGSNTTKFPSSIISRYDGGSGFNDDMRYDYTYSDARPIEELVYEIPELSNKKRFQYNEGRITNSSYFFYDNGWQLSNASVFLYDNDKLQQISDDNFIATLLWEANRIISLTLSWKSSNINIGKIEYNYLDSTTFSSAYYSQWNQYTNEWEKNSKTEYRYDNNGYHSELLEYNYDSQSGNYIPDYREIKTYEPYSSNFFEYSCVLYPEEAYSGNNLFNIMTNKELHNPNRYLYRSSIIERLTDQNNR